MKKNTSNNVENTAPFEATNSEAELRLANKELAFHKDEKQNRADELLIANKELAYQKDEKQNRADELLTANKELAYQKGEKKNRAAELVIANKELAFQNAEKEKRAAELVIANQELVFQNNEKENRAAELVIANAELTFQNKEKENLAAELVIANKELAFQNKEKENRAAELVLANAELTFQNKEKEKRAAELVSANKQLESFTFISSHDLQEPLRKIQTFSSRILDEEYENLSEKGKYYFERMQASALHMQTLINDLLVYSRTTETERIFEDSNLNLIIKDVLISLDEELQEKKAVVEIDGFCSIDIITFQFHQLIQNLISNSLKFAKQGMPLHIKIKNSYVKPTETSEQLKQQAEYCHISYTDNGIGFSPEFNTRIFELFQRLNDKQEYDGTGIGLTIVKKIIENHHGTITANGILGKGCTFDILIPVRQN